MYTIIIPECATDPVWGAETKVYCVQPNAINYAAYCAYLSNSLIGSTLGLRNACREFRLILIIYIPQFIHYLA